MYKFQKYISLNFGLGIFGLQKSGQAGYLTASSFLSLIVHSVNVLNIYKELSHYHGHQMSWSE
jgi:hypothetical protein